MFIATVCINKQRETHKAIFYVLISALYAKRLRKFLKFFYGKSKKRFHKQNDHQGEQSDLRSKQNS